MVDIENKSASWKEIAAKILNIPVDQVTDIQEKKAKVMAYALLFSMNDHQIKEIIKKC